MNPYTKLLQETMDTLMSDPSSIVPADREALKDAAEPIVRMILGYWDLLKASDEPDSANPYLKDGIHPDAAVDALLLALADSGMGREGDQSLVSTDEDVYCMVCSLLATLDSISTFTREMFEYLSASKGVSDRADESFRKDECIARQFVEYLGLPHDFFAWRVPVGRLDSLKTRSENREYPSVDRMMALLKRSASSHARNPGVQEFSQDTKDYIARHTSQGEGNGFDDIDITGES